MVKKKILIISNECQCGGATNSLIGLAIGLKEKYDVTILINEKGPLIKLCQENNLKYLFIKYKPFMIGEETTKFRKIIKKILFPFLKIRYIFYNKLALNKIDSLINMKEISLIHTNVNRDDFGALLSKKYNIPHIWHLREFGDVDYKCYCFRKNYIDFMNNNTDYFIAISNIIKNNFLKKGLDEQKIKVIYNGVKINVNPKPNNSKNLNILFLGGIQESKGQIELIEALNIIPLNIQKKIKVDFYGNSASDYKNLLLKKIKDYNLTNIFFHDYIDNVYDIMSNYNVGIMCSKCEAFGLVIVEYMINKLITIVPDTGSSQEIVTKDAGFIYHRGDYSDLANIIIKIFNMKLQDRKKIINNGYKRAINFSVLNNTKNIINLYQELNI